MNTLLIWAFSASALLNVYLIIFSMPSVRRLSSFWKGRAEFNSARANWFEERLRDSINAANRYKELYQSEIEKQK